MRILLGLLLAMTLLATPAMAQPAEGWVTSWAASVQGPYPVGNPSAQPDQRFAFPVPAPAPRPDLPPDRAAQPLGPAGAAALLQCVRHPAGDPRRRLRRPAARRRALVPGTNQPVRFGGKDSVTIPPGGIGLERRGGAALRARSGRAGLPGRKLAVSFHVAGESGPMTWHAKALQTSYVTAPGAGAKGKTEDEAAFPYSTASWFFLDALDMMAPADTPVVVAFGDSITDGTASTMNGDDRWPDVLSRRLHARYGNRVAVVNAGIGGNQVAGPAGLQPGEAVPGRALRRARLERDVLEPVRRHGRHLARGHQRLQPQRQCQRRGGAGRRCGRGSAASARELPGVRVIGATLTSALSSTSAAHGFPEQDEKRKALNEFIRTGGLFDARRRFRRRDARPGDRRPEAGVRAGQHHRRPGRQAASQPRRLPGDGDEHRPLGRGARAAVAPNAPIPPRSASAGTT